MKQRGGLGRNGLRRRRWLFGPVGSSTLFESKRRPPEFLAAVICTFGLPVRLAVGCDQIGKPAASARGRERRRPSGRPYREFGPLWTAAPRRPLLRSQRSPNSTMALHSALSAVTRSKPDLSRCGIRLSVANVQLHPRHAFARRGRWGQIHRFRLARRTCIRYVSGDKRHGTERPGMGVSLPARVGTAATKY
jgi:hypothetical protein